MEISDLIPLVVIVGSIIYSIITNTGKKKQTEKTMLPGKIDIESPKVLNDENYKNPIFEKKEIQKETKKAPTQIKKKNIPKETTSLPIEDNESENFSFAFDDTEEVKKAIIYSEIFNKKEWN